MNNGRLSRLRMYVIILTIVVVFAAFAAPLLVVGYIQHTNTATQLAVACTSAKANISQLEAIRRVSRTLGLPPETVEVPSLPPECV